MSESRNVKYVVQEDDNDNSQGDDHFMEAKWPSGSRPMRALIVVSVLTLVTVAGYLWYQAAMLSPEEAEEAVEVIGVEFVASTSTLVSMEPAFTEFETIAAKKGWTQLGRADPSAELEMIIALQPRNVDILEERLLAAATPGNLEYGNWLTKEEVHELTSPDQSTVDAVLEWHGASMDNYHPGGFIKRVVTVEEAEALLNADYYVFEHTSGKQVIRMNSGYSIESSVATHISFVSPSVRLPARSEMESGLIIEEIGADHIDADIDSAPAYLRTLYNISGTGSASGNKQGVAEFLTQIFSQEDQDKFYSRYYPPGAGTEIKIKGDTIEQVGADAGIETMLDTEYITVTGTGIETEDWSYMFNPSTPFLQTCPFLDWILNVGCTDDDEIPKVFSVSYGDDESDVGPTYANRLNFEFMKVAARGVSILFASGDSGANCVGNEFSPDFPAALPYVTAVGGTRLNEHISTWRLSGGGFSNVFRRPSWQDAMVLKYLEVEGVRETAEKYNADLTGAAYPDVSAMSVGYPVVCAGVSFLVSGTSCSTPVFAGIISLLNDYLLNNGKSTLGFLNPWLYSTSVSKTFEDVTDDYNLGCNPIGWLAATGWDPVTGMGYPNFGTLRDLL